MRNLNEKTQEIPEGMEVKEGIVVDQDNNPIGGQEARPRVASFGFSLGPWIGGILLILMLFAGFTIFATLAAVFIAVWLIRSVLRLFGLAGSSKKSGF